MSRAMRSRICAAGFVLGCLALLIVGMPERLGEASAHMPGWSKALMAASIMGLTSVVVLLAWIAIIGRTLEWTRSSIARIEARRG